MNYDNRITIDAGKRGGQPCIRNMRISVYDVLGWLAAGMTEAQILSDYPELESQDIRACLAYAADREHRLVTSLARGDAPLPMGDEGLGARRHFTALSLSEWGADAFDRGRGFRRDSQRGFASCSRFEMGVALGS